MNEFPVVRPTQFVTHCVTFRETEIKAAHIPQVAGIKTFAKRCCQLF